MPIVRGRAVWPSWRGECARDSRRKGRGVGRHHFLTNKSNPTTKNPMCWLHTDLKGRLGNTLDALISTLVFENVTRCQITAWTDDRNYQSLLRQLVGTAHEYKIAPSTHASACRPSAFIETCPNITLSKDGSKYFDGRDMRIQSCMQFRTPGMNQYAFLKEYSAIAKSLRHTLPCYAGCKKGMHIRSGDGIACVCAP